MEAKNETIFVDWITITQIHTGKKLPVFFRGIRVWYDRDGNPRHESVSAAHLGGSYETTIQIRCDGSFVSLSGNIGRFCRRDNLFNYSFWPTIQKANRILLDQGLPAFTIKRISEDGSEIAGAKVSRLDLTCNLEAGNEQQGRAVIRWLSSQSVSRMKRGVAGDESVWWSNTRHMLKAYLKHAEMLVHGIDKDDFALNWCQQKGVVRVEVELKRRLLKELGLNELHSITNEKLEQIYRDQTQIFSRVDRSSDLDILDAIPIRSRIYASAWLAGEDVLSCVPKRTLYRHNKILKEYGLDIMQPRNVKKLPVVVRVIDLKPLFKPDWYELEEVG